METKREPDSSVEEDMDNPSADIGEPLIKREVLEPEHPAFGVNVWLSDIKVEFSAPLEHDSDVTFKDCETRLPKADRPANTDSTGTQSPRAERKTTFACGCCEKSFDRKCHLSKHLRTHNPPYICKDCGRSFQKTNNLLRHTKVHSGVRPFSCEVCGKTFARMVNLRQHSNIHVKRKYFACPHCKETFNRRLALSVHELSHLASEAFACEVCEETFFNVCHLLLHMQSHPRHVKPFVCEDCNKIFKTKFMLAKHLKTHDELIV